MGTRVYTKKKKGYSKAGTQSVGFQKRVMGSTSSGNKNRGELKALDVAIDKYTDASNLEDFGVLFSNPPAIMLLNDVGVGAGFYQRVGRKIEMKSLEFKVHIRPGDGASTGVTGLADGIYGGGMYRFLVIYDTQTNGVAPVISDILQCVNSLGTNVVLTSNALVNLNNRERFKVLRDIELRMPQFATVGGVITGSLMDLDQKNYVNEISDYVKLKGLPVQYKADAATVPTAFPVSSANIATGAVYLVLLSNVAAAASGYVAQGWVRLRYYDV